MTGDSILINFADYVARRNVEVNLLISPHRFSGRGLGIRANADIPSKTRLMFVPTEAVLKWDDIPSDFMPSPPQPAEDGTVRLHCRLACWLAFGEDVRRIHESWMATWPKLKDFKTGMPRLWPEEGHSPQGRQKGVKKSKLQKTEGVHDFAIFPFGGDKKWLDIAQDADTGFHVLLARQRRKFDGDLATAAKYFPSINDRNSSDYENYLWAWCSVNTRCFYYWPTWSIRTNGSRKLKRPPPAPKDRDEAMVMCPCMDFFNHNSDKEDSLCCVVQYDESGFTVTSPDVLVKKGEELLISYGAHSEEYLWVEYGFMLSGNENQWDHVNLDAVVFHDDRLGKKEQALLKDRDYAGDYILRPDGVCWRTEIAARMCILTQDNWDGFVEGTYQETDDENSAAGDIIVDWILKAKAEAVKSLTGLLNLTDAERFNFFSQPSDGNDAERGQYACNRAAMCVSRWEQIEKICESALRAVQGSG